MEHHDLFEVGGVHVSRLEDVRLITGAGTYASDWNLRRVAGDTRDVSSEPFFPLA